MLVQQYAIFLSEGIVAGCVPILSGHRINTHYLFMNILIMLTIPLDSTNVELCLVTEIVTRHYISYTSL